MTKISAEKVLAGAKVAPPYNIFKLADPEIYDVVPYAELRAASVGNEYEKPIGELLDLVTQMNQDVPGKEQKVYEYFILSLCQIFQGGKNGSSRIKEKNSQ